MNIIVPINADDFNKDLLNNLPILFKNNSLYLVFMGNDAESNRSLLPEVETAVIINEDYNFSRAIYKCLKILGPVINQDDQICVCDLDFAFSYPQIKSQLSKIDFEKEFVYIPILFDKSKHEPINISVSSLIMRNVFYRIDLLKKCQDYEVHNNLCILSFHGLLEIIRHLEETNNNFKFNDIFIHAKKLLTPIKGLREGLAFTQSKDKIPEQTFVPRIHTPEKLIKKAIKQGIYVDLKTDPYSALKDEKRKKVVLSFPEVSLGPDPTKQIGSNQQWLTLIKLLNKTNDIYVFIVGEYPWDEKQLENLDKTWYVKNIEISSIEYNQEKYVIYESDLTFGLQYRNPYLEMSNDVGTPTYFYGWYIDKVKNPKNTYSLAVQKVDCSKFDPVEVYNEIKKLIF